MKIPLKIKYQVESKLRELIPLVDCKNVIFYEK